MKSLRVMGRGAWQYKFLIIIVSVLIIWISHLDIDTFSLSIETISAQEIQSEFSINPYHHGDKKITGLAPKESKIIVLINNNEIANGKTNNQGKFEIELDAESIKLESEIIVLLFDKDDQLLNAAAVDVIPSQEDLEESKSNEEESLKEEHSKSVESETIKEERDEEGVIESLTLEESLSIELNSDDSVVEEDSESNVELKKDETSFLESFDDSEEVKVYTRSNDKIINVDQSPAGLYDKKTGISVALSNQHDISTVKYLKVKEIKTKEFNSFDGFQTENIYQFYEIMLLDERKKSIALEGLVSIRIPTDFTDKVIYGVKVNSDTNKLDKLSYSIVNNHVNLTSQSDGIFGIVYKPGTQLPQTGEWGSRLFKFLVLLIILSSGYIYYSRKKG